MLFSVDIRPARRGDCLLLHFGARNRPGLVLIDGGPGNVYRPHLKPRLKRIREARGLDEQDPLVLDLLLVSHVDDDHIRGILDLTREEIEAREAHRPGLVNVLSFWHNSFDALIDHDPGDLTASMRMQFGEAAVSGGSELSDVERLAVEEESPEHPEVVASALKVLASIEQGFTLRKDAERLGFPRNPEFGGKLILARQDAEAIEIPGGLRLTVLGPMQRELEALRKKHIAWLEDLKRKGKSPSAALAAYIDSSVANLSSIVVLAEAEGKSILLTGDARGDKVLEGLQLAGRFGSGGSTISVDVLKVPHHGSANNLDHDFFERIIAHHYIFSGDGEHGNPERESLEMLFNARGNSDYRVHFTYPVDTVDAARRKDWEKEQQEERNRRKKNPALKVRPDWSPAEHSLAAFLQDHEDFAAKLRVAQQGKPHVINLLDELGY
jgi:hypothetical protein